MRPYHRLVAWQRAHELALDIYRVTGSFPPTEKFWLTNQLRRASFSAAANIVEGSGRPSGRERRRFYTIAHTSLQEVAYALEYARDLEIITRETWQRLDDLEQRTSYLTWRLRGGATGGRGKTEAREGQQRGGGEMEATG